jgi:hypothetical protein
MSRMSSFMMAGAARGIPMLPISPKARFIATQSPRPIPRSCGNRAAPGRTKSTCGPGSKPSDGGDLAKTVSPFVGSPENRRGLDRVLKEN